MMQVCNGVIAILNNYLYDSGVMSVGFLAISGLAKECLQNKDDMQRAGAIPLILKVMDRGNCSCNTVAVALQACVDLLTKNVEMLNEITSSGSLKTIKNTVSSVDAGNSAGGDAITQALCRFVAILSGMGSSLQLLLSDHQFCALLIKCTRSLVSLPSCRLALWSICALCYRCTENRVQLGALGACETVLCVKRLHSDALLIQLWSCAAIANLTDRGNAENIDRLMELGVCEELSM